MEQHKEDTGWRTTEEDRFVLTPQEKEYVSKHTVTDSDPGLLIRWDWPVVEAFAAASNGPGLPPRPSYIQQMPITARYVRSSPIPK